MTEPRACDECLRRAALVGLLGDAIEAVGGRARVPELLALADRDLIAAVAGPARARIERAYARFGAAAYRDECGAAAVTPLCRHAAGYPRRLEEAADAPAVLHVAGRVRALEALSEEPAVAIVGARRASDYGLDVARALARGVAAAGVSVVSGMALGIDSAAHTGALAAGGTTVAVLASGADVAYPPSKHALHRRILEHGCAVSELPPGTRARRWAFPARNRTIAGLARMTIVVEGGERSGSLITAGIARDLGREVGAVPGHVTSPRAAGPNALLFDGALVVRGAQDVLDALFGAGARRAPDGPDRRRLDTRLARVLDAVAAGRDTLADLVRTPDELEPTMTALGELELLGHVRRGRGGRYAVSV